MFGRRKREQAAAAEAAREAERHALFARLAERPEHICPFLGLEGERSGYVDGVSDEHRCFAFGDPAPLSAEQQTRVCQERGYGNCPRYLRGVLVIPTEELEALRQRRAPLAEPAPPAPEEARRRRWPLAVAAALLLLVVGGAGAYLFLGDGFDGTGVLPSVEPVQTDETAEATPEATAEPVVTPTAAPTSTPSRPPPTRTAPATPTPEPTPEAGDAFAFYEVSVGPTSFTLYAVDERTGEVTDTRTTSFSGFSFARAEPIRGSDGETYWETQDGDLAGWSYLHPDSGEFRIRAVFLNAAGERRSEFLPEDELTEFPEATPAP